MNTGKTPDESLYSGGLEGNSAVHVALYDATFSHSTAWHHAESLLSLIGYKAKENAATASGSVSGSGSGLGRGSGPVSAFVSVSMLGLGSGLGLESVPGSGAVTDPVLVSVLVSGSTSA